MGRSTVCREVHGNDGSDPGCVQYIVLHDGLAGAEEAQLNNRYVTTWQQSFDRWDDRKANRCKWAAEYRRSDGRIAHDQSLKTRLSGDISINHAPACETTRCIRFETRYPRGDGIHSGWNFSNGVRRSRSGIYSIQAAASGHSPAVFHR